MPCIDIDLDEIYDDLSSSEKYRLAKWLTNDGYMETEVEILEYPTSTGLEDEDVVRSLLNILNNRDSLTNEERQLIKNIGDKI